MRKPLIIFLTLLSSISYAQIDSDVLLKQANAAANAAIEGDWETLMQHTYPTIVEQIGGEELFLQMLESGMQDMETSGVRFLDVEFGKPGEPHNAEKEIHCLIPQTLLMKVEAGKLKVESHLLAISRDGGENWFFIDTALMSMESIKGILPNFNNDLKIPAKKSPTFIAD